MRIFPCPFEGIHPDFPEGPRGSDISTALLTSSFNTSATVFGILGLVTTRIFRNPRMIRPVGFGVLGCTTAYTSINVYTRYKMYQNVAVSMEAEGKTPPSSLFTIDKLAHFNVDNSSLAGSLAGYALVIAAKRPLYLRIAMAGLGGYATSLTHAIVVLLSMDPIEREKLTAWTKQRMDVLLTYSRPGHAMYASMAQTMMEVPAMEAWAESKKTLIPAHEKVGCDLESWPDTGNGPHASVKEDGTFIPQTRYNWTRAPPVAVRELEEHIEVLQRTRQDLATESETLYAWLAHKEKEYYNCSSGRTSDDCTEKRRAAETLGAFHNDIWRTVTDYDWMILDAKKRIEQYRAMAASPDGRLDIASPPLPSEAAAMEPKETLHLLEGVLEEIQRRKDEIEEFRQLSPQMFSTIGALRKEVTPEELDRRIDDTMRSADLDDRVVSKLIEEARARRYED